MHLRFYNIWDCVIFSFILPRGYYDELNQCKCIYPRWQWHHQSPAGVHDDQCRVKDLLEESQCRQSSTWSTWDNSQNWRKLFKTRLVTRVFRFTSKLEFCLVAWGAHAYRYDRATDPKKIYRPINDILPALFVFNGNFNGKMARFWISYLVISAKMTILRHVGNHLNVPLGVSSMHQTIKGDPRDGWDEL